MSAQAQISIPSSTAENILHIAENVVRHRMSMQALPVRMATRGVGIGTTIIFAVLLLGMGLGFYGLHQYLSLSSAPYVAHMVVGISITALTILSVVCILMYVSQKKRKFETFQKTLFADIENVLTSFVDETKNVIEENPEVSTLTATISGYAVGRKLF